MHIRITFLFLLNSFSLVVYAGDTLKVVNWNLEWFCATTRPDPQQQLNKTRIIMDSLKADVYALCEIVNTDSLFSLVKNLNGDYDFIVSGFGSQAESPSSSNYATAQKLAFVYNTNSVRNVSARPFLKESPNAYYNFASGRFPFLVSSEVLDADGNWLSLYFLVLHAKANSDNTSCNRRVYGNIEMKDSLDLYFSGTRFILLGDYNDDLDNTICSNYPVSTYYPFLNDSLHYKAVTLPLSKTGVSSYDGYPNMIDHVIVSPSVFPFYISNSASVLKQEVQQWVSSYTYHVSDHYPVRTLYKMYGGSGIGDLGREEYKIFPNPAWDHIIIQGISGHLHMTNSMGIIVKNERFITDRSIDIHELCPGIYVLRIMSDAGCIYHEKIIVN